METAINGKVRFKWFWGGLYSGSGMTPIERIFKIGRLLLAKVIYSDKSCREKDFYRPDILKLLGEWYDVKWENMPHGGGKWYTVYSKVDGGYVGDPEAAYRLLQQGIGQVQKAKQSHNVCSIGFNAEKQKWYGWSHRARYGFGIGDEVKEGDCCASSGYTKEYLLDHPEEDESLPIGFKAESLGGAKKMAIAFAESVS